jgi:hypothetical protein
MTKYRKENRDKMSMSDSDIIRYGVYNDMQNKYVDKYKEAIAKILNSHFYKDVSNIINDYLITYIY